MHGHAGFVLRGDAPVHRAHSLETQQIQQRPVQLCSNAPAPGLRPQVDRELRAPLIGGPNGVRVGVRVAQELSVLLPDKVGVQRPDGLHPAGELHQGRDLIFKGDYRIRHVGGVDLQNGRGVLHACQPERPLSPSHRFHGQKYRP